MAEKKARKKSAKKNDPQDEPQGQQILQSKEEMGRELTKRAKSLLDPDKRNILEVGKICFTVKNDDDLWSSQGFKNYDEWLTETFGKGKKTAINSRKIYEKVTPYLDETQILGVGMVKAFCYSRLPESEREKQEWKDAVLHDDSTTFKQKVQRYLKGAPDHRENFTKILIECPKSLKAVHDRVMEGYGNVLRSEDPDIKEPWQVHEAIMVQIEQEHQDNTAWAHPESDAAEAKEAAKDEEKAPSEEAAEALAKEPEPEPPNEEKVKAKPANCKVCDGEMPVLIEPANWVRGKLRLLEKAPLKIRQGLKTSQGFLCGNCYFELNTDEAEADGDGE